MTPWAAKCTACCEEPHCRSMVVPGTDSGKPAARTAFLATLRDWAPTCITQPRMTSSTRAGSRSLRAARALSVSAARSTGCQPERTPLRLPPAVRTASTMTALGIVSPLPRARLPTLLQAPTPPPPAKGIGQVSNLGGCARLMATLRSESELDPSPRRNDMALQLGDEAPDF